MGGGGGGPQLLRAATGTPASTHGSLLRRGLPSPSPALAAASLAVGAGGGGGSGSRAPQSAAAAAQAGARVAAHFSANSSLLAAAAMPPLELLRSPAVRRMLQASREALPRGGPPLHADVNDGTAGHTPAAAAAAVAVAAAGAGAEDRARGTPMGADGSRGAGRAAASAAGGGGVDDDDRGTAAAEHRAWPSSLLTPPFLPLPTQQSRPPQPQQQLSPSDFGVGASSSIPGNGGSPAVAARRAPSPPPAAIRAPPPTASGVAIQAGAASPGEHEWPALLPAAALHEEGQAYPSTRQALGTGGAASETLSAPYPLPPHATAHAAVSARSGGPSWPLSAALDAAMSAAPLSAGRPEDRTAAAGAAAASADFHDPRAFATLSGSKRGRDEAAAAAASTEEDRGDGTVAAPAAAADSEAVAFDATGALDYESS